ncbi:uncharacterized protein PHALS_04424 [Plasmopara halstedii]|uniref:Uncharacterized protein n=1 Tax=Plasmopara halstedii TaxID=4781 RepID=A0A0P1AYK6_PLAHL|nr:uncharacterized protein PHALS_04424 [Plasmopara halstedii]CEG47556.1 hypothetical protein PHALS_04424 [Plasmopara halstedii]|eukprot:XP_024583925.1 hypothetical protein PHALS_04424 [Plasmopara halstedii]
MAHDGSNLFQIRRIFGFSSSAVPSGDSVSALNIAAMAVHTSETNQLLALAIVEEVPEPMPHAKGDSALASKVPADAKTNFLLVRTIEEDRRTRFWRFPVCSTPKQQKAGKAERLFALEFSPEGDWLAALSQRKNRLHLVPVLTLIANQRRAMLDASYQPTSHHRELMNVNPAAMTTQMASYLRATNEFGGLNGARYHSRVAGDDEQMSTLEFAPGIGRIMCVRWWRSLNGKNYCLVGGTESLISIVNVEENAEECRCELVNAGTILSIELMQENFKKERRTSMLVKSATNGIDEKEKKAGKAGIKYYRVVLEKKFQSPKKADTNDEKKFLSSTLKVETTSGQASSSSETNFKTTGNSGGSVSSLGQSRAPNFVIKTFPQHFLEEMDFRPQRVKKNLPHVNLYPINGVLSSESSLALYDCKQQKVSIYSNFHWRVKGEFEVPDLRPVLLADIKEHRYSQSNVSHPQVEMKAVEDDDEVVDVDLTHCSMDLMLLQGRMSKSSKSVSTWVSLPSNQGTDENFARAHIVHYLSLHGNERVERVVQSTAHNCQILSQGGASGAIGGNHSSDAEIIYILQTKHHVYECRPQWSRLTLFKALCARKITLRDALSIGYALHIDMASLCQVVADTLHTSVLDGRTNANDQLIEWVCELLKVSRVVPSDAVEQLTAMGGVQCAIDYAQNVLAKPSSNARHDESERQQVAFLLFKLVLQQQLQVDPSDNSETDQPRCSQKSQSLAREAWLVNFLKTNDDYITSEIMDLCLSQQNIDKAILVAIERDEVPQVIDKIVRNGLTAGVSEKMVRLLIRSGHSFALTSPASRLILRSCPIQLQVEVLLAYPPAIVQQRDWLLRNLAAVTPELCRQLAGKIDPTQPDRDAYTLSATKEERSSARPKMQSDVSTSEVIKAAPEDQVELYLTLLLHLNSTACQFQEQNAQLEAESENRFSQARLELLMKSLATQYRPPIMVSRCVDYDNWTAAACIYEAHGELVEALECRLRSQSPQKVQTLKTTQSCTTPQQYKRCPQEQMRGELLELLDSLVVQRHTSSMDSDQIRAAILARILVKWFDYGLERIALEEFLCDPNVFQHVSSLLAQIFFSDIVNSISSVGLAAKFTVNGCSYFDDRDLEWVHKCQQLSFSGQFIFRVCVSFLENGNDESRILDTQSSEPSPLKLLELVTNNIIENDLSHRKVSITPHSAQALGKTDPLETHVKVFTCSHLFPKRVFEEEVVPEFEKRMNALPMPLFATKQAFIREFKRGSSETPCPVCSFNKISQVVFQHFKTKHGAAGHKSPIRSIHRQQQNNKVQYYYLHQKTGDRLGGATKVLPLNNEIWEWSYVEGYQKSRDS